MPKKKKEAPKGAPEWMVTYGDMMSLLLCFFVILVSMSEMKQDERFQKVLESIKRAFGYHGGVGWVTGEVPPTNTLEEPMQQLVMRKWMTQVGKSTQEGIEGARPSVKTIREGLNFTIGGRLAFEAGKARLLDHAKQQIDDFCEVIRGMNNKIRIRGHAAQKPPEQYAPFDTLDDLSYARAQAVKDYMIAHGIRGQRMTIEACGASEPLDARAYDEIDRARNRRVEIIWMERLVQEYQGEPKNDRQGDLIDG